MTAIAAPKPLTIPFSAWKEKDKAHYIVNVGDRHRKVLAALRAYPKDGLTDSELTFYLHLHMAAARRCELRDMGAVRRGGRRRPVPPAKVGAWAWKLTEKGRDLLTRLEAEGV